MLKAIRTRIHLTPSTVIATLALVFAMTGGAYAANKFLITSTKQISPKVLKSLQGKVGKAGANGAQGQAGAAGATGAAGPQGPAGAGATGPTGPAGAPGAPGAEGKEGSFNKTLPKGKTLEGDWSLTVPLPGEGLNGGATSTAVSFGIPLAAAPEAAYVNAPTEQEVTEHKFPAPPTGCTGNVQEPGAEPGHLCVFAAVEANVNVNSVCTSSTPGAALLTCINSGSREADRTGFAVGVIDHEKGLVALNGSWAVTAE